MPSGWITSFWPCPPLAKAETFRGGDPRPAPGCSSPLVGSRRPHASPVPGRSGVGSLPGQGRARWWNATSGSTWVRRPSRSPSSPWTGPSGVGPPGTASSTTASPDPTSCGCSSASTGRTCTGAAVTGRLGRLLALPRIPVKQAQAAGHRHLHGEEAATIVSIGSHGFSVLELLPDGTDEFRQNSRCSQGTGNFLRQLVERFQLSVEEASAMCEDVDGSRAALGPLPGHPQDGHDAPRQPGRVPGRHPGRTLRRRLRERLRARQADAPARRACA